MSHHLARTTDPNRAIPDPARRFRGVLIATAAATLLALILPLILIAVGHNAGRGAWDSIVYHEVFVRQLAEDFPRFDLSNPLTATTPGYHILLAACAQVGLGSTAALRLVSALIGAALSGLFACWVAKRAKPLDAVLLSLPMAASIYVVSSSAWLLPDNLAWMGVLAVLACCVREPRSWKPIVLASIALVGLVFTRQIHIWAAAPIWLAAWLGVRGTEPGLLDRIPARLPRAAIAGLLTVPAFVIVWLFVRHWGGATPPRFQADISGINPATPAFMLVQITVLMVGFGPWLLPAAIRTLRDRPALILGGLAIGLVLAIVPHTTQNPEAGRYSGWWMLAGRSPVLAGRTSLAFLVLAPAGAALLVGPLIEAPRRTGWILLGALVAFAAAQSATINSWQRYHEPFLILFLAMLAASQPLDLRGTPLARLRIPAMALLCAVLGAITLGGLRGEPVAPGTPPPAIHTMPGDPWEVP